MNVQELNEWSMSATALAAAILWQSALLASLVAGVCWLLRRSTPALRYWCWQIVALKLVLMPWWTVAISLPGFPAQGTAAVPHEAKTTENREDAPALAIPVLAVPPSDDAEIAPRETLAWLHSLEQFTWRSWLVLAWLAGIALQIGYLLIQRGRLSRLLRRATPAEPRLLAVVEQVAGQLGLSRRPALVHTDGDGAPFVCGLFRPVLVLPRRLLDGLDADHWHDVLVHELGHLKRGDLWWGWLPALARIVYFFHPVAHWIWFRIRLEQELACDQLAMALSGRSAAIMPRCWFK
jgi:bla regulator protein blaR1